MKRLISHVRLLFDIQLVHLFSNIFETARYNMIIHVIVFLVKFTCLFKWCSVQQKKKKKSVRTGLGVRLLIND